MDRGLVGTVKAVCMALAAVLLLTACAGQAAKPLAGESATVATPTPAETENPLAAGGLQDPRVSSSEVGSSEPSAAQTPTRIQIPSIGVDSNLENLAIGTDGSLAAPVDYDMAGWYAGGVVPGDVGPAIIAGHIDSPTAPAVFARIAELGPGAQVIVSLTDGEQLSFHVTGSTQSAKSTFPTSEVYSNVPAPELRLITCAGAFDSTIGHYTDNLIVFATLDR